MELSAGSRHLLCHSDSDWQLPRKIQGQVHCTRRGSQRDWTWPNRPDTLPQRAPNTLCPAGLTWAWECCLCGLRSKLFGELGKEGTGGRICPLGMLRLREETSSVCRPQWRVSFFLLQLLLAPAWDHLGTGCFLFQRDLPLPSYLHVYLGRFSGPSSVMSLRPHQADLCVFSYMPL